MAGTWPGSANPEVFQIGLRQMPGTSIDDPGTIWQRVQDIVTEFCGGNSTPRTNRFKMASALWLYTPVVAADIQPHEVIVYLLNSSRDSLIMRNFGALLKAAGQSTTIDASMYGLTLTGQPKHLSEVYCSHPTIKDDPDRIATAIIHEIMHNKLDMDDSMHGLATGIGPSSGFIQDNPARYPRLVTSGIDISNMAPVLGRVSLQFLA